MRTSIADAVASPGTPTSLRRAAWLGGLLALVFLAWCAANGRWTLESWRYPTAYTEPDKGDVVHALAMMKAGGNGEFIPFLWKGSNDLGAPNTANWNDWPLVEEFLVVFYAVLGKIFGLFAGLNVATVFAHLTAAASFYLVARWQECSRVWSFVAALAYGLAPFIFAQSPFHITTEYVWHVPLFIPIWSWVSTPPGIAPGSRRFWFAVGVGFVAGLQSPYYTNILCQLTLIGGLISYARGRSWPALKSALAVIGAAAAAFVLMNLDTWTYKLVHGPNPGALVREYKWLEIYGLKLVDLVVPPITHHFAPFARFALAHRVGNPAQGVPPAAPLQDEGSYLGLVGLAALAWLVATAVRDVVAKRADSIPAEAWQVLWIVICFTTGGLNAILGAFGFTLFRTGCRYSIVILAIVLMYAARRLTAWQNAATSRPAGGTLAIGAMTAAVGLVLLVLWDQVPRAPAADQTAAIARQVDADRDFVARMEAALPEKALVFQLPVMDFPESPLPGVPSYDHFRPYLYSKGLRFSFGSMKGREADAWQQRAQQMLLAGAQVNQQTQRIEFNQENVAKVMAELKRLGFSAITITRNGYPDRGRGLEAALLEAGYDSAPIRSTAGDLVCIPLVRSTASGN